MCQSKWATTSLRAYVGREWGRWGFGLWLSVCWGGWGWGYHIRRNIWWWGNGLSLIPSCQTIIWTSTYLLSVWPSGQISSRINIFPLCKMSAIFFLLPCIISSRPSDAYIHQCITIIEWDDGQSLVPGIILCMRPANERRCYNVTLSLIGRALTQNYPCCSAPSYYLNHCWLIVDWTIRNKFQLNLNLNSKICIEENAFEYFVCKLSDILSQAPCVNSLRPSDAYICR